MNSRHAKAHKASGPDNPSVPLGVSAVGCAPHAISHRGGSVLRLPLILSIILAAGIQFGCRDTSPEVQRVPTPAPGRDTSRNDYERQKSLPGPDETAVGGPAPFHDEPLLIDTPPEAKAFVDTYKQVGKPRIVVFVNRGLDGQILPVTDPGKYHTAREIYLQPGQYDEARAMQIDYEMLEMLLADWMSADNQVTIISPQTVHRQLTEQEQRDLQAGKPAALGELGKRLDADVLIQVQAKPTRQTYEGLEVRVI